MPKNSSVEEPVARKQTPFVRLLVADEFRFENNGKMFVIGLYADGVVIFRVPRNAPPPSEEQPYGLDILSLLVVIGGFVGEDTVRISFAKNKPLEHRINLKPGASVNIHLAIRPFTFASFGVKDLVVEVAGKRHKLPLELRVEYMDPVDDLAPFMAAITRPMPQAVPPVSAASTTESGKAGSKRERPRIGRT